LQVGASFFKGKTRAAGGGRLVDSAADGAEFIFSIK
jgi:hypothetical protein